MQNLFVPFVSHFASFFDNPWQYFFCHNNGVEFPYNPLILYVLSFFSFIFKCFGGTNFFWQNVALKLPSLIADIVITWLLFKSFPNKIKEIIIFYCLSPIVIYAVYFHSQLDLIPTAVLFAAVYFLKKQYFYWAAFLLGCAISIKFHVIAAMPLMIIYAWRNFSLRYAVFLGVFPLFIYVLFIFPFVMSEGFYHLVLTNPKQMMMFNVYASIGELKLYLPFVALFTVYGRFFTYKKINNDLLDAFLGVVFSLFVLLIIPAPGWYVWMLPFLSVFFIKIYYPQSNILFFYLGLSVVYMLFFVIFFKPEHSDLLFLQHPLNFKIYNERLSNLTFSILDVFIFLTIYALYKFGVKSNAIYRRAAGVVIGIGGDSGAGKSTLMADIKGLLGDKVTDLEGDGDHKWDRFDEHWKEYTHLNPKANYIHRQAEQLLLLKMGNVIHRISYDHATGKFTLPEHVVPNDFIILSGLHPFYLPKMRKLIDLKIYLDPDPRLRVHWKVIRDSLARGYSKEKVFEQLEKRRNDTEKYINPQKCFADLVIQYFVDGDFAIGNEQIPISMKLKIILDSSIKLEPMVHLFATNNYVIEWDYTDDLETQLLILSDPIRKELLCSIAKQILPNIEEIMPRESFWQDGYRGFVQLIILILLSEKMKEQELL